MGQTGNINVHLRNAGKRGAALLFAGAILLSVSVCAFSPEIKGDSLGNRVRAPLKIKGAWPGSPLTVSDIVVRFEDTTGVTHRISRLLNASGVPEGYVSHIETPVCSDTLCNLMDIRMFWDLSGSYWGFDTIPLKPLTKNDHLEFDEKDYQKLHELLLDEQSILRRRHKDDLFEKEEKRVSQVVDAVTGATAKEVKEAVVDGAVYSSYTIYHLVHSQLAAVIREDVKSNLWSTLKNKLSTSEKVDERVFFIRELPQNEFERYSEEIIATIPAAVPRDRLYIMKKMPAGMWVDRTVQVRVAEMAQNLDIHSLSHFLNQLKAAEALHLETLQKLSDRIPDFSLNQLKVYLGLLERSPDFLGDPRIQTAIKRAFENPDYRHRPFLSPYLKQA